MATQIVYKLGSGQNPFLKDPDAILDYSENWTAWLLDVADTIQSAVVIFPDADTTLAEQRVLAHNGLIVTIWLEGGRPTVKEAATIRITTVAGRVDDRTLYFKIADK